jgi:hypothetical protein
MFNPAQIHLALNHIPVVSVILAIPLLLWARFRPAAYVILVIGALTAVPAFLTGEGAEEVVEHAAGVAESAIHAHEEAAEGALVVMALTGALALASIFLARLREKTGLVATIAMTLVTAGMMGRAAHLGGLIRHPEIRTDAAVGGAAESRGDSEENEESE